MEHVKQTPGGGGSGSGKIKLIFFTISCSILLTTSNCSNQNDIIYGYDMAVETAVNSYRRGYMQAIIDINMGHFEKPTDVTVKGNFTMQYLRESANKRANEWREYLTKNN